VRANREVVCWGLNGSGQLGDGSTLTRPAPVTVQGVRDASHVSAGWLYSCAVADGGRVLCWGADGGGQLGDGPTDSSGQGAVAVAGITDAVAVSAGQTHVCALRATGEVVCWGNNAAHQCGDGTTTAHPAPVAVLGITGAVQIAAGTGHTCALVADGLAHCWGANGFRELGDGTSEARTTPVQVIYSNDAIEVGTGGAAWAGGFFGFSCALQSDGTVKCWGLDDFGQRGTLDGPPGAAVVGLESVAGISLGAKYACALRRQGDVWCWGINDTGELGDGTTTPRSMAAPVVGL
jgi:alpha-tubulin suppressor-like RCC1 family protein